MIIITVDIAFIRRLVAVRDSAGVVVSLHADVRKRFVVTFLDASSDEFFVIFRFRVHVARFEKNLNLHRRRGRGFRG